MAISVKIDYACKALLELALHWPHSEPLQLSAIAQKHGISAKFLTQIFISLKQLGIVQSVRGKNGGYLLSVHPREIKLSDIVLHFGNIRFSNGNKPYIKSNVMGTVWKEIDQIVLNSLQKVTFEDICNRQRKRENIVMFEI